MRWVPGLLCLVAAAGCGGTPATALQPPPPNPFATPRSLDEALARIDEMLRLPDDQIDVALASMIMAAVLYSDLNVEREMLRLELLASEARPSIMAARSPRDKAIALSEFVVHKGFRYAPEEVQAKEGWDTPYRWLHQLLNGKEGMCNSLSLLYLALGDRSGLRLSAVVLPKHVVVRFHDGGLAMNLETTRGGVMRGDDEYRELFHLSQGPDCYLRPLTRREHVAMLLTNHLAYDLSESDRYKEALQVDEHAVEVLPQFPDPWVNRGVALRALGRPKEAVESYDRALRLYPDAITWNDRGNALGDLGRFTEALENLDRALVLDPKYSNALYSKAAVYRLMRRLDDTLKCLEAYLRLNPNSPKGTIGKGSILGDLGRHEEALIWFDRGLKLQADSAVGWFNRGNSLVGLKRHEEAIASFDQAIQINPKYSKAWLNKAGVLDALGRAGEALDCSSRAIELAPDWPEALDFRANLRMDAGDRAGAIQDWERCLKLRPDAKILCVVGYNRSLQGDIEGAFRDYEKAHEVDPAYIPFWTYRGGLKSRAGDYAGALANFDQAMSLDPKNPFACSGKALTLAQMGRNEEAIVQAEKALAIDPKKPYYAFAARGLARLNLGRPEEALKDFDSFDGLAEKDDPVRPWVDEARRKAKAR